MNRCCCPGNHSVKDLLKYFRTNHLMGLKKENPHAIRCNFSKLFNSNNSIYFSLYCYTFNVNYQ